MNAQSLDDDLSEEQEEYAQNVYVYHLVNAATSLAKATKQDWWSPNLSTGYIRGFRAGPFSPERILQRRTWRGGGVHQDEGDLDSSAFKRMKHKYSYVCRNKLRYRIC